GGPAFPPYPPCNGPVARLYITDQDDFAPATLSCVQADRDRALAQNGCTDGANGPTEPWGTDLFIGLSYGSGSCMKYSARPAEYPVVFCTTVGRPHDANTASAIPGFTRFISEIEGAP